MVLENQIIERRYASTDRYFEDIEIDYSVSLDNIKTIPNINQFIFYTLPPFYRILIENGSLKKEILYFYILSVAKVIEAQMFKKINDNRIATLQRFNWSAQTLIIQQALRDTFQSTNIWVQNVSSQVKLNYLFNQFETIPTSEQIYLFNESESTSGYYQPTYLHNRIEYDTDTIFTIDSVLICYDSQIKQFINKYINSDKKYKIEYVSI